MKWLVWGLLLVNAMLFGYFRLAMPPHAETAAAHDQNPSKIKIVPVAELDAMNKPAPPAPAVAAVSPQVTAATECYEWGSFAGADALRAKAVLDRLAIGVTARKHTPQEAIRYWVYIPPLKSPEAVQAKAAELRQLGVDEIFIVQEAQWRNAISLGVFRDEGLASKFLDDLRLRGVKSAIKGQRNLEGEQTGYLVSNLTSEQRAEIDKIRPEFLGSDLKPVDCK